MKKSECKKKENIPAARDVSRLEPRLLLLLFLLLLLLPWPFRHVDGDGVEDGVVDVPVIAIVVMVVRVVEVIVVAKTKI